MVRLQRHLDTRGAAARLVLQVHDELVLELPAEEVQSIGCLVKEVMEGACSLDVPLVVDTAAGGNWRDLGPLDLKSGDVEPVS